MKNLVAFALMASCAAAPASACDETVIHLASYHTDREFIQDVNEANFGIGCRVDHVEVGAYLNSYGEVSAYGLVEYSFDGLSAFAGLASGYEQDVSSFDGGIAPIAGVSYHFESGLTLRAGPSFGEDIGAVIGASWGF